MSIRLFLVGLVAVIAGCAATGNYTYKLYSGPTLPDAELAAVQFGGRLEHVIIDGLSVYRADYGDVLLSPGEHSIVFDSDWWGGQDIRYSVQLEKGRQYLLLKTDVWPFCCPGPVVVSGQKVWGWVQDATSEAIVGEIEEHETAD
ncbi:MAG: hypothetical protein OEM85_17285 [Gammaproteobacteria bacterium]|nr:hypothetical protein [Gammaproteobacteria bacterium]